MPLHFCSPCCAQRAFAAADGDGSGGITFDEFCAFYNKLNNQYEGAGSSLDEETLGPESVMEELVACPGCKRTFLPGVLPTHQRSCDALLPKMSPADSESKLGSGGSAVSTLPGADGAEFAFVPCKLCGRTFFPDRLPVHMRMCARKNGAGNGCRETMTDGKTLSVGKYDSL